MSKYSKIEKVLVGFILFMVLILCYCGVCAIILFRGKKVPLQVNSCIDYYNVSQTIGTPEYSYKTPRKEFRNFVKSELGIWGYLYFESDKLPSDKAGLSLPIIRTIIIDDELDNEYEYYATIVHEFMHLKHFIINERFVCWQTFLYLWESEELHDIGVWYARHQVGGAYSNKYDISDLIVDYLTKK